MEINRVKTEKREREKKQTNKQIKKEIDTNKQANKQTNYSGIFYFCQHLQIGAGILSFGGDVFIL